MKNERLKAEHTSGKKDGSPSRVPLRVNEAAALQIWKQFEDLVVPQLKLSVVDHAVYSHLLRHSRLEGKRRLHLSMYKLGRGTRLSSAGARHAVRRLVAKGALNLVERSKAGHVLEVRLPEEIRKVRSKLGEASWPRRPNLERFNFWKDKGLRKAIHRREGGKCFYCLRRITARLRCIDHVVPQVRCGASSYRNLVSSCGDCNAQKGEEEAGNFLRKLYREGRLTVEELNGRLRAVKELAAGRLRPEVKKEDIKDVKDCKGSEGGKGEKGGEIAGVPRLERGGNVKVASIRGHDISCPYRSSQGTASAHYDFRVKQRGPRRSWEKCTSTPHAP